MNVDDGTDAMTVVFGKEKGGYARGVGSGVTYIRGILIFLEAEKKLMKDLSYFKLNLIMRDASVKKKDLLVKQLSNEMSEKNPGLKLVPTKRKHLVSSETLQKQAKATKSQQVLTYGS